MIKKLIIKSQNLKNKKHLNIMKMKHKSKTCQNFDRTKKLSLCI